VLQLPGSVCAERAHTPVRMRTGKARRGALINTPVLCRQRKRLQPDACAHAEACCQEGPCVAERARAQTLIRAHTQVHSLLHKKDKQGGVQRKQDPNIHVSHPQGFGRRGRPARAPYMHASPQQDAAKLSA